MKTVASGSPKAERGAWEAGAIPGLLSRIVSQHFSGRLSIASIDGEAVELRFALGEAIGSASLEELAHFVLERGDVPAASLHAACEAARREGRRLSAVLCERGLVDQAGLRDALGAVIRASLARVLSRTRGTWALTPGFDAAPAVEEVALGLPTRQLVLEACRQAAGSDGVRFHLGDPRRVPDLRQDALERSSALQLEAGERFLLSRVGDGLSLRDVQALAPPGCDAERSLLGLACAGLIDIDDPPPRPARSPAELRRRREVERVAARVPGRTPHETLGVEADASDEEIREAYTGAVKRFHPDAAGDALADLRPQMQRIVAEVVAAYRALAVRAVPGRKKTPVARAVDEAPPAVETPPPPAAGPVTAPDPPRAAEPDLAQDMAFVEEGLLRARSLYRDEQYWDAIQLLDSLQLRAPGGLRSAVRLLRAQCYVQNPLWLHEAEHELRELLDERPDDAEVAFQLGRLYARAGLRRRAAASLRRALRRDPAHSRARHALADLETARLAVPPRWRAGSGAALQRRSA